MQFFGVFSIGLIISFLGSIPPGTINVSVMQLTMNNQRRAALFLAIGAVFVEFLYAGMAVKFQQYFLNNQDLNHIFQIVTAGVLIVLGVFNLISKTTSANYIPHGQVRRRSGFKKGLVLGILNPMTIPFWLAVTTYLQTNGWIGLDGYNFWGYLVGLSTGTFLLLVTVEILGNKFQNIADNRIIAHQIPGMLFILMGLYNLRFLL
jgi:threonine/homoserine/homoserine lactone efflux protein